MSNQQISHSQFTTPAEIVAWMGAIQAQDYPGAKWSIGLRLPIGVTDADIEQAVADRELIRTWPMRGTLHFVAPQDVRWMLKLLTPRVIAGAASRRKNLSLNDKVFGKAKEVLAAALQVGRVVTRAQLLTSLEQAGIATANQRGYHILWQLSQDGLICFGPNEGKQPTFVWLEDWLPPQPQISREEALAKLTTTYFSSHGPATVQDFMWWSGLTAVDARAGIALAGSSITPETIDDSQYFLSRRQPRPVSSEPIYLLPGFDEYLLGYKDRSAVLAPAYSQKVVPGGNGMFLATILVDGQVVGTWKKTATKSKIKIKLKPFDVSAEHPSKAIAEAANRYASFTGLPVEIF